jgi:siroheme synthase
VYVNTITITLTIAPGLSSAKTCLRVIVIVLIYRGFNRPELGCYGQSYSDRADIHVLTELNSGAIVRVIVIVKLG